eukprot:gene6906-30884_t
MSSYLRNYIERVADVPSYLKRHLALIRDLDEKVVSLQQQIEETSKAQLLEAEAKKKRAQQTHGKRQRQQQNQAPELSSTSNVENEVTRLLSLADEKVTIAQQIYDFVDKHIQYLDNELWTLGNEIKAYSLHPGPWTLNPTCLDDDLRTLGNEIRADKERLGMKEDETVLDESKFAKLRARTAAPSAAGILPAGTALQDGAAVAVPLPVPLEVSNEPLYCYCQMPSHGEMVACDNDECPTEWFHYNCVGLSGAPDGEWFCPDCTKSMKMKN